jgi:hypothetical protein
MEKTLNLNQNTVNELIDLYREISKSNSLFNESRNKIESGFARKNIVSWKSGDDIFEANWKVLCEKIDKHKSLPNISSTISEITINARAVERDVLASKNAILPIYKSYTKARIYYQTSNNMTRKGFRSNTSLSSYFGIILICELFFNDRSFKFKIARSNAGRAYVLSSEIETKSLCITNERMEIKFESQSKFDEIVRYCEEVISSINTELDRSSLIRFESNLEIY